MNRNEMYRTIPKVDQLLKTEAIAALTKVYGSKATAGALQEILSRIREEAGMAADREGNQAGAEKIRQETARIAGEAKARLDQIFRPSIRPVINGTGTILHTGLGRAPLGSKAAGMGEAAAKSCCSLEYDPESGKRGERNAHIERLLCRITGAEAAFAVNNNAAAVLLILSALAKGGEAVVSRGELVEIGGRFRIPDVMELSGAKLRETGTTNKTRLSDYEEAVREETKLFLKVHTSNYRIVGFTESVPLSQLCRLGKQKGICVVQDLGSGVLVDLSRYGRKGEPTVQQSVAAGADVVCFSGDKLLGGPQAGIVVGRKCFLDRMRRHPLSRALRIDKFTAAALEQVLTEYLDPDRAVRRIPVLRMLTRTAEEVREEARALAERIQSRLDETGGAPVQIQVQRCMSCAGGGALPGEEIDSFAVSMAPEKIPVFLLHKRLRMLPVPVVGRIARERLFLDMRTIDGKNLSYLARVLSCPGLYGQDGMSDSEKRQIWEQLAQEEQEPCRKEEEEI